MTPGRRSLRGCFLSPSRPGCKRVTDVLPGIGMSNFDWIQAYGTVALSGEKAYFEQYSEPLGRWYEVTAYSDEPGYFITVFYDISEQKQAERAMQEGEKRFQKMLALIPDAISIQDAEMNIIYSNWNGFLAVPEEKRVLNTKCYQTYRGYNQVCPDCRAKEVLATGEDLQEEARLPDGTWIDLRIIPILDENNQVALFVEWIRDISDLKRSERALQGLNLELERINRELDAFSYSVSHDLRAPLYTIQGFSQAVLEDYSETLDEQGVDYLQRIHGAGQRMGELIEDLLKLSRATRLEMHRETVNLSDLAASYLSGLQQQEPERQVAIIVEPDIYVTGDASLLRIALENLLDNAWKFTRDVRQARIEFGTKQHDGRTFYYISDNGAGFDMAYAHKLFHVFQRLHDQEEYAGTGIGLSIVTRIIQRHGGMVWAEGEVGRGAKFLFTIES